MRAFASEVFYTLCAAAGEKQHMFADGQGAVSVRLSTAGLAPGAYTLVARGNTSGLIAVGSFDVK